MMLANYELVEKKEKESPVHQNMEKRKEQDSSGMIKDDRLRRI